MGDIRKKLEEKHKAQLARLKGQRQGQGAKAPRPRGPRIHVGTNVLSDQALRIPIEEFFCHTHIMGVTQMGKSKFMENLFRQIVDAGHGMIVLDGKGDLYHSLLKYCIWKGLKHKTIAIDPNDDEHSVGINYLELFGEAKPAAWASTVLKGLMKMFEEENDFKPWLQEWGPAALTPLIDAGMTLTELTNFVSVVKPEFRETILDKLGPEYQKTKERWEELKAYRDYEATAILQVLRTRGNILVDSPVVMAMLGQQKTTINWKKVMDEGGIVLVNLHSVEKVDEGSLKLLGIALFHQIIRHAYMRPKTRRKPCFVMVDEFQQFASSDFQDAMARLMGFGVYLMLSHQNIDQIREKHPALWSSVLTCWNKIYFNITDKDAQDLHRELFAGMFKTDKIKDEISQTKFRPHETTRTIEGYSSGSSSSRGRGSGSAIVTGSGQTMAPDGMFFGSGILYTSSSSSSASSFSDSSAEGFSESSSSVTVPFYEYEEFMEVSSRTYWTPQEFAEKFIAWMTTQDQRRAQMKIGQKRKPIPIYTAEIQDKQLPSGLLQRFLEANYKKIALPTAQVLDEINQRVQKFIEAHKPAEEITETRRIPKGIRDETYKSRKTKTRKVKEAP